MTDPFDNPEINARIVASVARVQSAWLEWCAEPTTGDFDTKIVETLVDTLDAHARVYLDGINGKERLPEYRNLLRAVGSLQVKNAEKNGLLSNPYSEQQLRMMAERTGHIVTRRYQLTAEQYEEEVRAELERCRSQLMPEAKKWREWYTQILIHIETRFEARYRHWEAEAIERALAAGAKSSQANEIDSKDLASVHAGPAENGSDRGRTVDPQFPGRASWLKGRLLERGWSTSDPSKYRGPDRKTVEKILRGAEVRNDVLEKLAEALSAKLAKVSVLEIPQS